MTENDIPNKAQQEAIDQTHLSSAIVTAAAGSGKTTLLVQRIVRLLSDEELNIPADSLAVMTFTRNATASMREKLNKAISGKLEELANADTAEERERYNYLKKQLFLLRQAAISTIDAFCLRMIKENAEAFELPLNFTIADGAKKAAMQSQAMKAAMQELYGSEFTDEERNALFFSFSFEDDSTLEKTILSVSEKLACFPDPEQWINNAVDVYKDIPSVEAEFLPLIGGFLEINVRRAVLYTKKYKDEEICKRFGEEIEGNLPDANTKAKKDTLNKLKDEVLPALKEYIKFDEKRIGELKRDFDAYQKNPSIANLCALMENLEKNSENPPEKYSRSAAKYVYKKRFKAISDTISDSVSTLLKIKISEDSEKNNLAPMQKNLQSFFKLLKIFMNCYELEKKTSGCIDFSDCERELYNKLSENGGDNNFRRQLSKRFSCIIVDEFQDSNDIQAEIFRLLGDGRLFYVGDVKQSIYSFRGADPYIMARLCENGSGFKVLPLNINYRSRIAVINTVNAAFRGLMTAKYGGVDYSDKNELHLDPKLSKLKDIALYDSEIHLLSGINQETDGDSDKDMAMPNYVAKRIQELHDNEKFLVRDGKDEEGNFKYRRAEYSDFIILLRTKNKIDCYRKALAELGISSTAPKGSNFFETDEVLLVYNYLKIIDNPLLNEEMLKVMMSPIYRLTAEETAQIKMGILGLKDMSDKKLKEIANTYKRRSLYSCIADCMKQKARRGKDTDDVKRVISPKLERFWNDLRSFRYFMTSNSPDALIRKVYEDTELIAVVAAFEDSAGRVENIRRLQKTASDFVSRSGGSLGDLLRFMDRARENGSKKVEEAARPEIAANAVRIMTFHGSKGLEAPVCIMSELQNGLNKSDFTGNYLISCEHFMAMEHTDIKRRRKTKPLAYHAASCFIRERLLGDELRLLYVAMTRARDKLIMVSTLNKENYENFNEFINADSIDPDLHDDIYCENKPFMCVLKTLLQYAPMIGDGNKEFDIEKIGCRISAVNVGCKPNDDTEKGTENDTPEEYIISEEEVTRLSELIMQKYPHIADTEQQAKFTTTELAHKKSAKPISLTKPLFAQDNKVTGVEKGNAYHHCMQHIPPDCVSADTKDAVKAVENTLDKLEKQKKITSEERKIVEPERIARFFTSELGRRMSAAYAQNHENVKREQSFYAEVNGRDVRQDYDGVISIQGQIDMYFIENGEIVVVDYKSDTIENLAKEIDNYKFQVEIYMKILKKLTGMNVKEMYLYAFLADRELKIE